MKNFFATMCLTCAALSTVSAAGYDITVKVKNNELKGKPVNLAFYFNGKTYSKDTSKISNSGIAHFHKDKDLDEGVYIIYFDANKYFDVLVGKDQKINITIDTAHIAKPEVKGAPESVGFQDLVNFMADRRDESKKIADKYKDKKMDSTAHAQALDDLSKKATDFQEQMMAKYKGLWLEKFIKGTVPVEVPEMKDEPDSSRAFKRYLYGRDHYFDNIDLSDPRFLRTPYFPGMVDGFMKNRVLQHPDTLYLVADRLIEKSRHNKETFQTMCSKMINYGISSNQMGMDGLWSRIAQKYYLTEPRQATWADSAWVEDLRKEVKKVRYNLVGMDARDLKMRDYDGRPLAMSTVIKENKDVKYLLAYFFEPTCGHCRKTTPVLYDSVYKDFFDKGFGVYAIYTQTDKNEWKEFLDKNHLQGKNWFNVWDPDRESYFWEFYDATVTPGVYLIDTKTGKIIAKKIDMSTLHMILDEELIKRPAAEAEKNKKK